jgi:hypothetical protein
MGNSLRRASSSGVVAHFSFPFHTRWQSACGWHPAVSPGNRSAPTNIVPYLAAIGFASVTAFFSIKGMAVLPRQPTGDRRHRRDDGGSHGPVL